MKNLIILASILMNFGIVNAQDIVIGQNGNCSEEQVVLSNLKISDLDDVEKAEAVQALIAGSCYYKGIKLWGKVKFVTSYPDFKIQYVESYPDIKVKFVKTYPDKCGLWQITDTYPDFKVQVVNSYPDIKIKVVETYPGVN